MPQGTLVQTSTNQYTPTHTNEAHSTPYILIHIDTCKPPSSFQQTHINLKNNTVYAYTVIQPSNF